MNKPQILVLWVGVILGGWVVLHPPMVSYPGSHYDHLLEMTMDDTTYRPDHRATTERLAVLLLAVGAGLATLRRRAT